jgi:hypothetical protein
LTQSGTSTCHKASDHRNDCVTMQEQVTWIHCILFFIFMSYSLVESVDYVVCVQDGSQCPSSSFCSCSLTGRMTVCKCCDNIQKNNCSLAQRPEAQGLWNDNYYWIVFALVAVWFICRVFNGIFKTRMVRAAESHREAAMHQQDIVAITVVNDTPKIVQVLCKLVSESATSYRCIISWKLVLPKI